MPFLVVPTTKPATTTCSRTWMTAHASTPSTSSARNFWIAMATVSTMWTATASATTRKQRAVPILKPVTRATIPTRTTPPVFTPQTSMVLTTLIATAHASMMRMATVYAMKTKSADVPMPQPATTAQRPRTKTVLVSSPAAPVVPMRRPATMTGTPRLTMALVQHWTNAANVVATALPMEPVIVMATFWTPWVSVVAPVWPMRMPMTSATTKMTASEPSMCVACATAPVQMLATIVMETVWKTPTTTAFVTSKTRATNPTPQWRFSP